MSIAPSSLHNPLLNDLGEFLESPEPLIANQEANQLFTSIARDESDEEIFSKIRTIFKAHPDLIDAPSRYYQTTALTLAVMKDRFSVVNELLQAKADPNNGDEFGWTPMIHSALASKKISSILLKKSGDPERISFNGVSFESLCELTAKETNLKSMVRLTLFDSKNKCIATSKKNLESVMGLSEYRSKSFYHPQHLQYLWSQSNSDDCVHKGYYELIQTGCKMGFPLLAIKNDEKLRELGVEKAQGLFSGQTIAKGQLISTYVGESIEKEDVDFLEVIFGLKTVSAYLFEPIDAARVGNEARMINDGFPNTFPVKAGHEVYFLALRSIKNEEELLFNYGASDINLRWGRYLIKNKLEAYRLFRQRYAEIFEDDREIGLAKRSPSRITSDIIFRHLTMAASVSYVFFTPQLLIDFVINQVVSVEQIKNLKTLDYVSALSQTDYTVFSWINELIDYLAKFELIITKLSQMKLLGPVQTAIRSKEGHCSIFQILHFMQNIEKFVEENQSDLIEAQLEDFLQENARQIVLYQFRSFDKSMPLFRDIDLEDGDMRDERVYHNNWQRLNQLTQDQFDTVRVLKDDELKRTMVDQFLQGVFFD
jgi:hypothetical protein